MKLVIIESPYAASPEAIERALTLNPVLSTIAREQYVVSQNLGYLRAALHDCLVNHEEAPFASHGLYTQEGVLFDPYPSDRRLGILAGFSWRKVADKTVVYTDKGISPGMELGIEAAEKMGHKIQYRSIPGRW